MSDTDKIDHQWPSLTTDQVNSFRKDGFLILANFAPPKICNELHEAIANYARNKNLLDVNLADSKFRTFNGTEVDQYLPSLGKLYDHQLLSTLQALSRPLATIKDRRIGLSINVTPAGGHFQPHFDRNLLTAILYVTEDCDGGEMLFFPRVRYWLGRSDNQLQGLVQRVLDRLAHNSFYQKLFSRRIIVKPVRGTLIVFEGVRTLHQVLPVVGENNRISIQFAYDHQGVEFDVSDYYGL